MESLYSPFVAGIDLPHQGVVDSYNHPFVAGIDLPHQGVVDSYNLYNGKSYKVMQYRCIEMCPEDIPNPPLEVQLGGR